MGYIEEASNANDANMAYEEDKAEILQTLEQAIMADPASLRDCFGEAIDQVDAVELHKLWTDLVKEGEKEVSCPFALSNRAMKVCAFLLPYVQNEIHADAYAQWENNYEG